MWATEFEINGRKIRQQDIFAIGRNMDDRNGFITLRSREVIPISENQCTELLKGPSPEQQAEINAEVRKRILGK